MEIVVYKEGSTHTKQTLAKIPSVQMFNTILHSFCLLAFAESQLCNSTNFSKCARYKLKIVFYQYASHKRSQNDCQLTLINTHR